jgi:hypothetical protein
MALTGLGLPAGKCDIDYGLKGCTLRTPAFWPCSRRLSTASAAILAAAANSLRPKP